MDIPNEIQTVLEKLRGSAEGDHLAVEIKVWIPGLPQNQVDYIIQKLSQEGLITPHSHHDLGHIYLITTKGNDVLDDGGWLKYFNEENSKKELNQELIKSTVAANRYMTDQPQRNFFRKNWQWLITTIVAIVAVIVTSRQGPSHESQNVKQSLVDSTELEFNQYLTSLPIKDLPLSLKCSLPGIGQRVNELSRYRKFIPSNADGVFGRLESGKRDFTFVVYSGIGDDIYGLLFSQGSKGEFIDSILLGRGCAGDDRAILTSYSTIGKDMTITVIDSMKWIHYPDNTDSYVLDSIVVEQATYKLDESGHFVKKLEHSKQEEF